MKFEVEIEDKFIEAALKRQMLKLSTYNGACALEKLIGENIKKEISKADFTEKLVAMLEK